MQSVKPANLLEERPPHTSFYTIRAYYLGQIDRWVASGKPKFAAACAKRVTHLVLFTYPELRDTL